MSLANLIETAGFCILSRLARCHVGANHRRFRTRALSIRQIGGSPAGILDRRRPYPSLCTGHRVPA